MIKKTSDDSEPRRVTIGKLLKAIGDPAPIKTLGDYIAAVRVIAESWQEEDWIKVERDPDDVLNHTRIVGQVWFRGQSDPNSSLRPGLYRESTKRDLNKQPGSPKPDGKNERHLFCELFDLEHEQRIDFTSYGHLLNEANQAKTATDWYFLMQHHGVPTRLLDWTTNALAALYFAFDAYNHRLQSVRELCPDPAAIRALGRTVAVWAIDAYWLANRLSEQWSGPLLPWSEDAERYIPKLESLIEKLDQSRALVPDYAMPIEPAAMHPRVAAQEGRFIIFGKTQDLLDEEVRLERKFDGTTEELRVRKIRFQVQDVESLLRDLAQLGVSKRTLFPDLDGLAEFVRWKHFHKVSGYKLKHS